MSKLINYHGIISGYVYNIQEAHPLKQGLKLTWLQTSTKTRL